MVIRTATKIKLVQALYQGFSAVRSIAGLDDKVRVQRDGVWWDLDLSEGIDFAVYLGIFERSTHRALRKLIHEGNTVLDIGANMGAHTLTLAKFVGRQGHVVAFEPTNYAFNKLKTNVTLNSNLSTVISLEQTMLTANTSDRLQESLYSSWPLRAEPELHTQHRGKRMATPKATTETLDNYFRRHAYNRLDLIKIDVDGHENQVLSGARECLERFHPKLVMEFAPYVHEEENSSFDDLIRLMKKHRYRYRELGSEKQKPLDEVDLRHRIPDGASLNVILEP